ncbi:hypothetical protein HDU96_000901 [Phlyctochytrium bullatum]|nr:hypothetical protein HDU96_000901 [Phlyctochytrium bullatum]
MIMPSSTSSNDRSVAGLHSFIARSNPERPFIIGQNKSIPVENQPHIVLREATPADLHPLSHFNGFCHGGPWFYDLFAGYTRLWLKESENDGPARHPVVDHRLLLVAVDRSVSPHDSEKVATLSEQDRRFLAEDGLIVSSTMGIPQVWSYGEPDPSLKNSDNERIPMVAYRIELVATHPDYRSRNLLQPQFDLHHQAAEKLSADFLVITGSKGFYRKFGYDMAPRFQMVGAYLSHIPQKEGSADRFPVPVSTTSPKELASDQDTISLESIPSTIRSFFPAPQTSWGNAEGEPYVIRWAEVSDAPFIAQISRMSSKSRTHVASDADDAWWANMVDGRRLDDWPDAFQCRDVFIIEEAVDKAPSQPSADDVDSRIGFIQISPPSVPLTLNKIEIDPSRSEHSWTSVSPTVLRWFAWVSLERERDNIRLMNASILQKWAKEQTADGNGLTESEKPGFECKNLAPLPTALKPDHVFNFRISSKYHPFLRSIGLSARTLPVLQDHAFYIRICSFPRLLRRLIPVFDARLARHPVFRGFTGTLVLFSTPGDVAKNGGAVVRIRKGAVEEVVVPGKDTDAEPKPSEKKSFEEVVADEEKALKAYLAACTRSGATPKANVAVFCPQGNALLFVQLLMGMTGAVELLKKYPGDVWASKDGLAALVLDVMFATEVEGMMNAEELWALD